VTNRYEILVPEASYHVYNRANGSEKLFLSKENYRFFLEKYRLYTDPIADTFCYCLMPNHFHFLIRIKSEAELHKVFSMPIASPKFETNTASPKFETNTASPKFETLEKLNHQTLEKVLSKQFSNLFSCYTQAFNKQQNRKGSLFMKNFNRIRIYDSKHLNTLVPYIHHNPVVSGLCARPEDWQHSSYTAILEKNDSFVRASELISLFEDLENFKFIHDSKK
jgi:putative transposase